MFTFLKCPLNEEQQRVKQRLSKSNLAVKKLKPVFKRSGWSAVCVSGVLEIRTVSEGGVLAIKGLKSQYYISMNRTGMLQGKVKPIRPANTSLNLIPANASHAFKSKYSNFYRELRPCRTCSLLSRTERLQRQLQLQRSVFRELLHSVRFCQKD